jgi:hypothetical protein
VKGFEIDWIVKGWSQLPASKIRPSAVTRQMPRSSALALPSSGMYVATSPLVSGRYLAYTSSTSACSSFPRSTALLALCIFSRTAIIPVWLVVFGLLTLFGSPRTFATSLVPLLAAGVALAIMLGLWKELPPAIVAVTAPDPPLAALPSADFVPNSWPDSGFRNSGQRGARGERRDSGQPGADRRTALDRLRAR